MVAKSEKPSRKQLDLLIRERGRRVLQKFESVAISGISDPKLLEVVGFVVNYWKDNFRPALASFCCEAVGGQPEFADDVSLMMSLTSAGGGIHDDIVDKSRHKHFRWTVLGKHGLDYALLVGDLLILKGWSMIRELVKKRFQPEILFEITEAFESWTLNVCEAEFMEISCRKNVDTKLERYQKILCKSMADTQACARLGAIMGGGSREEIEALAEFGNQLGFMHRLYDDLNDTFNTELNLFTRLQNESVPLPILYAAKKSKEKRSLIEKIIGNPNEDSFDFKKLLDICMATGALDFVYGRAKETAKEALTKLHLLKPSSSRSLLAFMVDDSLAEISNLCR